VKPVVRFNAKGEPVEMRCGNRRAVRMPYPPEWGASAKRADPARALPAHLWYLTHRPAGGRGWTPAHRKWGRSQTTDQVAGALWWVKQAVVPLDVWARERET
jgi:hypothetical protein